VTERTDHADAVDWDVAVRHERRRDVLLALMCFVAFPAFAVLRSDDQRFFVGAVGIALVAVLGMAAWTFHGVRTGRTDRYRALHALLGHLDPGPGLRVRTDELARQQAPNRYVFWLTPGALLLQAIPGRWDEPRVAIPAAAVFVAGLLPLTVHQYRLGRAAKRWLDDPPGPLREDEPGWVPPPRKQWASSRGQIALVGVGVVAVVLLVITVAESGA
jgi:hypothetical protein